MGAKARVSAKEMGQENSQKVKGNMHDAQTDTPLLRPAGPAPLAWLPPRWSATRPIVDKPHPSPHGGMRYPCYLQLCFCSAGAARAQPEVPPSARRPRENYARTAAPRLYIPYTSPQPSSLAASHRPDAQPHS